MASPEKPVIRPIEASDINALYALICALADNQGEREYLTATQQDLASAGFGDRPLWAGFIAELDGEAVGYATYTEDFHIWSAAPRITIDDVFVQPARRNLGLGEELMRQVFTLAKDRGAYVNWTVQTENDKAIKFYKRLGASYKVTGKCAWRAGN